MFSIALCIKKKDWIAVAENMILKYSEENNILITVDIFNGINEMEQFLKKEYIYDLFILDLEEPSETSSVIMTMIKEHNVSAETVFIASEMIQLKNWFELRPLDVLTSPFTYERFTKMLYIAIHEISSNSYFRFSYKNNIYSISYEEILYFESINRKINVVTRNNRYTFYGKLQEIILRLPNSDFLHVHKSYVVNKKYIQEYTYRECVMSNMRRIPISQINRKEIRKIMINGKTNFNNKIW